VSCWDRWRTRVACGDHTARLRRRYFAKRVAFAQSADDLLVVTTPEPTALADAYALIKVLGRSPQRPAVRSVVNRFGLATRPMPSPSDWPAWRRGFCTFGVSAAGSVWRDEHVSLAVRQRVPFLTRYPRCPASGCISALAEQVDRLPPMGKDRSGFFRRLIAFSTEPLRTLRRFQKAQARETHGMAVTETDGSDFRCLWGR